MAHLHVELHNSLPMRLQAEFDCAPGELVALVGPSGSGKSSLLRAVAGLLQPPGMRGRIQVGSDVWFDSERDIRLTPQQRCAGLVFQSYALFPHLSAVENIMVAMHPDGAFADKQQAAMGLLTRLGLSGLHARRPAQLSGGQQQRVALARALMRACPPVRAGSSAPAGVLLLDEPFSAVDAPTRLTLYRELATLRREVSTPMVLVTHDLSEARRLADQVVILDAGVTLQSGPPHKVFSSPRNARVADLVGLQNHFRGRFHRAAPGRGRLQWLDEQGQVLMSLNVIDKNRLDDGAAVTWVLVGEHVEVRPPDDGAATDGNPGNANRLACVLAEHLTLGETSLCRLVPKGLAAGPCLALNLSTAQLRAMGAGVGSEVSVRIPVEGIHIMPQRAQA